MCINLYILAIYIYILFAKRSHMKFRMGQRCNVGDCADGSGGHVRHVEIPPVVLGMSSVPEQLIASNAANAAAP